ncbi:polynucleotidyl transferase, ribonuclease H-like superfamily protein [Actinidia rufa]|uniref:Polynucleotidyl transferase, ribonuclease H-like superfamily protein n=1 Tax=Actinidia rufa TaxID=165716 RepID=A0A7J0G8S2_9ERIC|nr:polynucleotidyl transferase, ribonuclease H-like superfamily protein [Actinidia rufa]
MDPKRILIFFVSSMDLDGRVAELQSEDRTRQEWAICLHAFSDLSHVSPVVFLYLLKECYACGMISLHPFSHDS